MCDVTIAEAWPAAGRPLTVAELDRMPDDGRRSAQTTYASCAGR